MNIHVKDIDNEAQRWDDVRTLVLSSNTIVVKNVRNSDFARLVFGYCGDCDADPEMSWNGDDLKIVF